MNWVYILPILDNIILYAPLHGISAYVNSLAVKRLKNAIDSGKNPECKELMSLYSVLNNKQVREPYKKKGEIKPDFLGVIPTRYCNANCIYCDFEAIGPIQHIDINHAVSCVDWYVSRVKNRDGEVVKIHFFGGEPMMAPKVVTAVVHRARVVTNSMDLIPQFEISTNGQYSQKWAQFLADYFTSVVLSLDGPKNIQNFHRPLRKSFDSFTSAVRTAKIIGNSHAELFLRTCVSKKNVNILSDIARWFCEEFQPTKINFEVMQETPKTINHDLTKPDPYTFSSQFIHARNEASVFNVPVVYGADFDKPRWSSCPVAKDVVIVTPDGRLNSCYLEPERWKQKCMDLTVGHIDQNNKININSFSVNQIREMVWHKPLCEKCFCRWTCAGGCHVSQAKCNIYNDFCIQTRIITVCSILDKMNLGHLSKLLISDLTMMKVLAEQPSDLLSDLKLTTCM